MISSNPEVSHFVDLKISWISIFRREYFATSPCLSTWVIPEGGPSLAVWYACTKHSTLFRIFHAFPSINPSIFPNMPLHIIIFFEGDICWRVSILYDKGVWRRLLEVKVLVWWLASWIFFIKLLVSTRGLTALFLTLSVCLCLFVLIFSLLSRDIYHSNKRVPVCHVLSTLFSCPS